MTTQQEHQLKRGLKNRHIQLIALGGAVGTGLFLGIAQTIRMAGPSVLLGYAIAGVIAFFIMRQLGEMVVEEPVAGSFSHFANRYWGPFAGFMSGWNYWVLYVLVSMAELTAVGIYIQLLVAGGTHLAVGGDLLRGDQRHQPDARQSVWRAGVLVLDCQSGRHHQHDRLWLLSVI
ncbi:aromatic amino acid transport protein AroP [Klebsiella pneumoniae]|nr:aromatic amino acid transport protein AroP [Klebsiella pneumoniae]